MKEEMERMTNPNNQLNIGEIVDGDIQKITADGFEIRVDDDYVAFLSKEHLSDFKTNQDAIHSLCELGREHQKVLKGLLCLGRNKKKQTMLSMKKSLHFLATKNELVSKFSDLRPGLITFGYVSHLMSYGIFVELSSGIVGLVPNSHLADQFVSDASTYFSVGQSFIVKVTEIDEEKHRFLITSKPSQLESESDYCKFDEFQGISLLQSVLDERKDILNKLGSLPDGPIRPLSSIIGTTVMAQVVSVRPEGMRVKTENNVNGFLPKKLTEGRDIETGDVLHCYVIDVDMKNWLFIGTIIPEVIDDLKQEVIDDLKPEQKKTRKLKIGHEAEVIVQHLTQDYVVVIIPKRKHRIGYIPAKKNLNDIRDASRRFYIGQSLKAIVECVTSYGPLLRCEDVFESGKPKVGSIVNVIVKSIKAGQINVSLKGTHMNGRVHVSEIWDEIKEGETPFDGIETGDEIRCKIIGFRDAKTQNFLPITHPNITKALAELSLKPSSLSATSSETIEFKSCSDFKKNDTVSCYVRTVSETSLLVCVNPKLNGRINMLNSSLEKKVLRKFTTHFKPGTAYMATVVNSNKDNSSLELSLIGDPAGHLKEGRILVGKICKQLSNRGLLIELPSHQCGFVHITQLDDEYQEDPLKTFKSKMFARCCVLSVKDDSHIDLSLRPSRIQSEDKDDLKVTDREIVALEDIHEGDILRGYIKSCSKVGVFISLSSKIVGRVEIRNLSQFFVKDWQPLFPVGKLVKAKVLKIDPASNHIDLSLRGKDVGGPDLAPPPKRKSEEEESRKSKKLKTKHNEEEEDDDVLLSDKEEAGHKTKSRTNVEESDSEESTDATSMQIDTMMDLPRLQLPGGFDWTSDDNKENGGKKRELQSESESEDDDKDSEVNRKKSKRQKRAAKRAEEEYIRKAELALLDKDRGPESAEDFDRILLGTPNSSILWIQYMAFHLHVAETDKARAVAEKALKTISFREEQEKLNVWISLLNLENLYGTPESLDKVFQDAVKQNDPKKVFMKMADIYIRSGKLEEAESLFQVMIKRFKPSKKIWISYGLFLMKNKQIDSSRKLLQRSLKSIANRKHVETIIKFAVMEFKYGEPQRGTTVFESVLKNYPKRTDLWSVYIDMLIKQEDWEQVRNIFERATALSLSSKKMKFLFKRYLEFERKFGTETRAEYVKNKAMEYVERKVEGL